MQRELPVRKKIRLEGYDYSTAGAYFVTVCVEDRHEMLGKIVGRDVLIAPNTPNVSYIKLSEYGNIADKHINNINLLCDGIIIDKYVIMPNHIHMIIIIEKKRAMCGRNGAMRTSRPTSASIPNVMRSFKTMVTKEMGFSLWQEKYHDHIIRTEADYQRIWKYIDENPAKWAEDRYYK